MLALLGSRVPTALKIFLMALAIIDDLGAIVIIALFYTHDLSMLSLGVAAAAIAVLVALNLSGVRRTGIYILVGAVLWTAVLKSGVHATLAGVIVGFMIPLEEKHGKSPAKALEHVLHPWVAFMILPLFAFANAGVSLQGVTLAGLTSLLPLGIMAGLFIGKPLGISLFCWLALKLKWASLPEGTTCKQIMAVGILCGIGFTMSIFIATPGLWQRGSRVDQLGQAWHSDRLSAISGRRLPHTASARDGYSPRGITFLQESPPGSPRTLSGREACHILTTIICTTSGTCIKKGPSWARRRRCF